MITLPTLSQLYINVRADIDAEFGINISLIKRVALRAFGAVHAGKLWLQYKVLGFVQKNIWVDTADSEAKGGTLERFGRVRLGRNPKPAVAGQYTVLVTGSIGAVIPAQSTFKSDDTSLHPGFIFILDNSHSMITIIDSIILRALTPGIEAKLAINDTLSVTSPIALINKTVTVSVESVQPLAAETIEDYRAKVDASFRIEAQGGSPGDYRIWAADAQGEKQVYPYAKVSETNANNIYVEATAADSIDGNGTPSQAILDEVNAVIKESPDTTLTDPERSRSPLGTYNYILPVTPLPVDIEIQGFSGITAAQQILITNSLKESFSTVRPYVAGLDSVASKNNILDKNKVNNVIYSSTQGGIYTGLILKVNNVVVSAYTFTEGDIPYLRNVTYT